MKRKKKAYSAPKLDNLGKVGDLTLQGNAPLSDVLPFVDNTAYPPPS